MIFIVAGHPFVHLEKQLFTKWEKSETENEIHNRIFFYNFFGILFFSSFEPNMEEVSPITSYSFWFVLPLFFRSNSIANTRAAFRNIIIPNSRHACRQKRDFATAWKQLMTWKNNGHNIHHERSGLFTCIYVYSCDDLIHTVI